MTDYPITDEALKAAEEVLYEPPGPPWWPVAPEVRAAIQTFLKAEGFNIETCSTDEYRLVGPRCLYPRTPTEEENPKTRLASYDGRTTGDRG